MMKKKIGKSTTGFTLIELLVVISIIGLLASIVLASLSSARAKARDARRKADLHSLEVAIALYYTSNDGTFPSSVTGGGVSDWPSSYKTELAPYISSLPTDPNIEGWRYYGSYKMTWAPDGSCNGQYVLWAFMEGNNIGANTCGFGGPHYFRLLGAY